MKVKFLLPCVLISGITFLIACKKNQTNQKLLVSLLHCTQRNNGPTLCFDSLVTDSRCPKMVECVWQGTAIIKVSFYEANNVHRFRMSLKGYPTSGYPGDTLINGYQIVFTDLLPYPVANNPIEKIPEASFLITP